MKKTQPKVPEVSVLIPVHNAQETIARTLDSILAQTLQELEVICVDDGSTDRTYSILQEYARRDCRVRVISQENQGPAAARNMALRMSTGKYVTGIDADDTVLPEAYECAVREMTANVDIICFGIRIIPFDGVEVPACDLEYYRVKFEGAYEPIDSVILKTDVSFCNKLFRRSFIEKYDIRFPDGHYFEDACFCFKAFSVARDIFFLNRTLYCYYKREGSIMDQVRAKTPRALDHLSVVGDVYTFFKRCGLLEERRNLYMQLLSYCYFFAKSNAPASMLGDLRKLGLEIVREQNLADLAPRYPIVDMLSGKRPSFLQRVFSVSLSYNGKHVVISLLGLKIKIRRKKYLNQIRVNEQNAHVRAEKRRMKYMH